MSCRHWVNSPERQGNENKTGNGAPREATSSLGKRPTHQEQREVNHPDDAGPDQFDVEIEPGVELLVEQYQANRKPAREQDEASDEKAVHNFFQAIDSRHDREDGAEFVELKIVLLAEIHEPGDTRQTESAIREQTESAVNAGKVALENRFVFVNGVESRHEREDAHNENDGRREHSNEAQARHHAGYGVDGDDGPNYKGNCFVDVVDRAMLKAGTAQNH